MHKPSFQLLYVLTPDRSFSFISCQLLPLNLHSSYNECCLDSENHQKQKQLSEKHNTEKKKGKSSKTQSDKMRRAEPSDRAVSRVKKRYLGIKGKWTTDTRKTGVHTYVISHEDQISGSNIVCIPVLPTLVPFID